MIVGILLDWDAFHVFGLLKSPTASNDTKCAAAYILGRERLAEGVPVLVANMLLHAPIQLDSKLPLWGEYPAVQALANIGTPAVGPMLQNLRSSDDAKTRELSLRVLRVVEGKEVAHFVLTTAAGQATEPGYRDRLVEAVKVLDGEVNK